METLFNRSGSPATPNHINEKGVPFHVYARLCSRCGGQGRADKWCMTGYVCFQCGGSRYFGENRDRLYTQEALDKLNAIKAVRDEKKRLVAEAARKVEEARVEAERASVRETYAPLINRIRTVAGEKANDGFFASILDQVENKARNLSDNQIEAVERILGKIEEENARKQSATWVGEIGKRTQLDLTLVKVSTFGDRYTGITYYVTMRTAEGCTVFYKGSSPTSLGFKYDYDFQSGEYYMEKGSTTTVIATVKEHRNNKYNSEPETVIQRPKVVEKV
jgi:hypothetical protein